MNLSCKWQVCIWETFAHVTECCSWCLSERSVGLQEKWRGQRQPTSMVLQVFLLFPIQMPFVHQQHLTWCIQATPSDQRATYNMKFLNFIANSSLWKVFAVCTPYLSLSGNSSLASVNEYFLCFIFENPPSLENSHNFPWWIWKFFWQGLFKRWISMCIKLYIHDSMF